MKASWRRCLLFAIFLPNWFMIPAFCQQNDSGQSLGDVARKLRKDTTNEVKMTDADTKKLFESVDRIFAFAAEDTGMPKRATVKRRLVAKADVEKYAATMMAKEEFARSFAQEELSMKKLGFLPRDFNLKEFLVKSTGQGIAAYYDDETKVISMLNWVPPDQQEPILAHELTHALQDQNYDLAKWRRAARKGDGSQASNSGKISGDSQIARKAVVEGQAMVVYVDYLLKPIGRSLEDTPGLIYEMEESAVKAVADSQLMHDAPMILRETGTFAYKEGLIFEGELLHKGGKKMAFAGAFAEFAGSIAAGDLYQKREATLGRHPGHEASPQRSIRHLRFRRSRRTGRARSLEAVQRTKNCGRGFVRVAWRSLRHIPAKRQNGRRAYTGHRGCSALIHFAMEDAGRSGVVRALLRAYRLAALSHRDRAGVAHLFRSRLSRMERSDCHRRGSGDRGALAG
jgi:hypothetical protein